MRAGLKQIPELRNHRERLEDTLPGPLYVFNKNALKEVNPAEGAESLPLSFQLDPGQTLAGTVLAPDGKPLAGAHYRGLSERGYWTLLDGATFAVNCYRPDNPPS